MNASCILESMIFCWGVMFGILLRYSVVNGNDCIHYVGVYGLLLGSDATLSV